MSGFEYGQTKIKLSKLLGIPEADILEPGNKFMRKLKGLTLSKDGKLTLPLYVPGKNELYSLVNGQQIDLSGGYNEVFDQSSQTYLRLSTLWYVERGGKGYAVKYAPE